MIKQHWGNLSSQEQTTVKWGSMVVGVLLFAKFIWWPLSSRIDILKSNIAQEQELIEWMIPTVAALQDTTEPGEPANHNAPRLSTIEKSFLQAGLSPFVKSLSQNSREQIVLQANAIPFAALITCLEMLDKQYGITPSAMTATKQKTGVVDAEIVF